MPRFLRCIAALALALLLLPFTLLQAPSSTHAAAAAQPRTLTGEMVAAPYPPNSTPSQLLLQVNNRRLLVQITADTVVLNRDGTRIPLGDLHGRATLRVTGEYGGITVTAYLIEDLSLRSPTTIQLSGRLLLPQPRPGLPINLLCLAHGHITGFHTAMPRALLASPCGFNMAVYVNGNTRITDRFGNTVSLFDLRTGHEVLISAYLTGRQVIATLVKDNSINAQMSTLTGTLVATPAGGSANAQLLLQVGANTVLVQVSSATLYIDSLGSPTTLSALQNRDTVRVTGSYNGVQIIASQVQDLSLQVGTALKVNGLLASPLPLNTQPGSVLCISGAQVSMANLPQLRAQIATPCGGVLAVSISGTTRFVDQFGNTVALSALQAGDTLAIDAVLSNNQVNALVVHDLSLPASGKVTISGQVTLPLPGVGQNNGPVCVAGAQITGYRSPTVQAQLATVCGSNLSLMLNSGTVIENSAGQVIPLSQLQAGDTITSTATLVAGQFTAMLLQDVSR